MLSEAVIDMNGYLSEKHLHTGNCIIFKFKMILITVCFSLIMHQLFKIALPLGK